MATALRFQATASSGSVGALLQLPADAHTIYVLAHGAGAGMESPFLEAIAGVLSERGVATLRYRFPYMEQGRRRPGPAAVDRKTVRSAIAYAQTLTDLPLIAGGKSYGGRMSAYAVADACPAGLRGLAFLGFPLHPPGRASTDRWQPVTHVGLPMLFLQGSRDRLAELGLLTPLVRKLEPAAELHVVEGGDHSFKVPKRSGVTPEAVWAELADALANWSRELP